jgi:hypothetical protein
LGTTRSPLGWHNNFSLTAGTTLEIAVGGYAVDAAQSAWSANAVRGGEPITVRAARYVGDILKYVPDDQAIAPRYSFHM